MFLKIDNWLFAILFQPISDWSIDTYKRGPFWIAAVLGYLLSASFIAAYFTEAVSFGSTNLVMSALILFVAWDNDKKDKEKTKSTPTLNEARVNLPHLTIRIILLILSLNMLVITAVYGLNAFLGLVSVQTAIYTSMVYFEACETKPPAPPKKKEETKLAHATY